jgi:hypothetical protein
MRGIHGFNKMGATLPPCTNRHCISARIFWRPVDFAGAVPTILFQISFYGTISKDVYISITIILSWHIRIQNKY